MPKNEKDSENKYGVKPSLSFKGKGEISEPTDREHNKVYRISKIERKTTDYTGRTGIFQKDNPDNAQTEKAAPDNVSKHSTSYTAPVSNTPHREPTAAVTQESRPQETGISPENAERMKRAGFLERLNDENIKVNTANAVSIPEESRTETSVTSISGHAAEHTDYTEKSEDKKPYERKFLSDSPAQSVPERAKAIPTEIAERMKRAAFLEKLNGEKTKVNTASASYTAYSEDKYSDFGGETVSETPKENPVKTEEKSVLEKAVIPIPEPHKTITPEMAERMKRAAYIEQKNAEAIRLSRATAISEEQPEYYEEPEPRREDETIDMPAEHTEEEKQDISENSETVSVVDVQTYRRQKAYHDYSERQHRKRKEENGLERTAKDFQTVSELAKGNIAPIAENAVRDTLSDSANSAIDGVSTVGGSIKKSDSAGSAVMDLSATLAAIEAKKMVKNLANTDLKKKERAEERAKNNGNRFGIDKYDEVTKREPSRKSEKKEKQREEPKGRIKTGNSHKMREEKRDYAKKQKGKQIRSKRKELYLRDNPGALKEIVYGVPSGRDIVRGSIKKKATSLIIGGGAGAIIMPILLVIVIFILISAFFSWLSPFDYSLAGDDEGADPHNAQTKAEVIDGYTLMVKNYLDVTQAYYYLNYGDWYGGTYSYPAPSLDFSTFYSEYRTRIVQNIRDSFQPYIDSATDPNIRQAIIISMNNAISSALANAYTSALAEYNALMAALDDSMTAEENRQHYEVSVTSGANGEADSAEFTGKPVVGTNFFGNVEINSELSAEELLAYIALYKSLKNMDTSEPAEGEEISLNITPQDINNFFRDTEFFSITTEITENHTCTGANCKRRLVSGTGDSYEWEYYCDNDHQNLTGEIGVCKTADELLQKVMELANAEDQGVNENDCKSIIDSYIDMFKKELDVTEDDFRKFGAADNTKAQEFYRALIDGTLTNGDIWEVDTPITEE